VTQEVVEEKVYTVIEQMPQFPGGEAELLNYINKNIKYPVIAQENGVQGKVILRFVVSKSGTVDKVEVIRSLDPACDKEAVRVVKTLPRFIPGKQNGVNVSVWYTLPVTYRLE
jgi:protein TonB